MERPAGSLSLYSAGNREGGEEKEKKGKERGRIRKSTLIIHIGKMTFPLPILLQFPRQMAAQRKKKKERGKRGGKE